MKIFPLLIMLFLCGHLHAQTPDLNINDFNSLDIESSYILADKYINSKGVDMDLPKAYQLLNFAAQHNHPKAQFDLGKMYEYWYMWHPDDNKNLSNLDKVIQLFKNWDSSWYMQKSFSLYLKSAINGYDEAISEVGISYYQGRGTEVNLEEAYYWFIQGAMLNEYRSLYYIKNMEKDLTTFQINKIKQRIKKRS